MDPAIVGGLITEIVGLLAAVLSRTRCFMRVLPMDTGTNYRWQAGCGFTKANLVPNDFRIETRVLGDNEIIFARKTYRTKRAVMSMCHRPGGLLWYRPGLSLLRGAWMGGCHCGPVAWAPKWSPTILTDVRDVKPESSSGPLANSTLYGTLRIVLSFRWKHSTQRLRNG